jgi:NADH-quinone oxidoreductase subunit N
MIFTLDCIALSPELFLGFLINCLLLYGVLCTNSSFLNYPILLTNITWLGLQILIFVFILNFFNPIAYTFCFFKMFLLDQFGVFIKSIVILTSITTLLISTKYNNFEKINLFELIILWLLATLGLLLLISSWNFISLYLALEIQSFCLYIFAALNRNSEFSTEAGLKYFIVGAFFSGLLLFGFSLIYGFTGVLDYGSLLQFLSIVSINNYKVTSINIASIFILISLFFKLSVAPFHILTPDIYEGPATSISAFFAIVPKLSILTILTKFFLISFYNDIFLFWQNLIIISALLSILFGTFSALTQYKLKRFFAYSTVTHIGFLLIGLGCGSKEGLYASYLYILIYIITTIACFTILLGIYTKKSFLRLYYIHDLVSLARSNYNIGFLIVLNFFSIAGIPPLAGFFSKMFIFMAALQSKLYLLTFISILTTVVSCFYYIRVVRLLSFDTSYVWLNFWRFSRENTLILIITTFSLIFIGFYLDLIILLIDRYLTAGLFLFYK